MFVCQSKVQNSLWVVTWCAFTPITIAAVIGSLDAVVALFFHIPQGKEKGAPFPAALQYRADAWSGRGKPLSQLQVLKIRLIWSPLIEDVSDIKLIRTDTTLDLSQKAEKR